MTTNRILIQSVSLAVLFMFSSIANSSNIDRTLVTYFNKLYKNQSPKCSISEALKSQILAEIEPKCLIRTTIEGESYISGTKSECSEASVKASVDAQVNSLCQNTAYENEKAALLKQAQQNSSNSRGQSSASGGGSGGGAAKKPSIIDQARQAKDVYDDITKKSEKAGEYWEKRHEYGDKIKGGYQKAKDFVTGNKNPVVNTEATVTSNAAAVVPAATVAPVAANATGDKPTTIVAPETTPVVAPEAAPVVAPSEHLSEADNKQLDSMMNDLKADEAARAQAAKNLPAGATDAANNIVAANPAAAKQVAEDATKAKQAADVAADKALNTSLDAALVEAQSCTPIAAQIGKIKTALTIRKAVKAVCSKSSAVAGFVCPIISSPGAKMVQTLMSVGTAVLSNVNSASQSCDITSNLSKVAQGGMLLAQISCVSSKLTCDASCVKSESQKQAIIGEVESALINAEAAELATEASGDLVMSTLCDFAKSALTSAKSLLMGDQIVPPKIVACKAHTADVALMAMQGIGFLSAHKDAKKCKEQLSAGAGQGSGTSTSSLAGPTMTTSEYCAIPTNTSSITCKCTANPNADGCLGSLANSMNALGKINSGSGASAFASAGQNGLASAKPAGLSNSDFSLKDENSKGSLSDAAREALGMDTSGAAGSGAGGSGGGGGGGGSSGADAHAQTDSKSNREKKSFGLLSSLSNMFGGGPKSNTPTSISPTKKFEQEQAIKRKLASDQVRAEVSTASGKSNFDKIRSRYQQSAASFEQ